jgi:hypothetical protein
VFFCVAKIILGESFGCASSSFDSQLKLFSNLSIIDIEMYTSPFPSIRRRESLLMISRTLSETRRPLTTRPHVRTWSCSCMFRMFRLRRRDHASRGDGLSQRRAGTQHVACCMLFSGRHGPQNECTTAKRPASGPTRVDSLNPCLLWLYIR